jgi:hypothetical protein
MRIEYVIIGFVILAVVLFVSISMLSGAVPGIQNIFKMIGG